MVMENKAVDEPREIVEEDEFRRFTGYKKPRTPNWNVNGNVLYMEDFCINY